MSAIFRSADLKPPQSKALAAPRIPRETGFGDFCFGRILKADRLKSEEKWSWTDPTDLLNHTKLEKSPLFMSAFNLRNYERRIERGRSKVASEWTEEDFVINSHNSPFIELDGFERKGIFSFSKLPTEIRHAILRMVLQPLFEHDPISQQSLAQFSIRTHALHLFAYESEFFKDGVEHFLRKCSFALDGFPSYGDIEGDSRQLGSLHYLDALPESEQSIIQERYESLKKSFLWERETHPDRSFKYIISGLIQKPIVSSQAENNKQIHDFHMLKLIRQLSNLSNEMRQDLGTVIWRNAKLHITGDAALTSGPITCLMDRPGMSRGITALTLDIDCQRIEDFEHVHGGEADTFGVTCRYLSRHLQVANLELNFIPDFMGKEKTMVRICSGAGNFAGLKLFRSMIVTQSFQICFRAARKYDFVPSNYGPEDYIQQSFDLFLPETLRNAKYDRSTRYEKDKLASVRVAKK